MLSPVCRRPSFLVRSAVLTLFLYVMCVCACVWMALDVRRCKDADREPLVLVACGSFSPITFLHLRMFEMARDHAHFHSSYRVLGGYFSPVASAYSKLGLASALHRVNMCELAVRETSDWLMVDAWEARQGAYTPTAQVLDHFDYELNEKRGGVEVVVRDGEGGTRVERRRVKIMLLAGSDLILTMSEPGVWSEEDVSRFLLSALLCIVPHCVLMHDCA